MFAIARELGCTIEELMPPPEPTQESRVAWSDLAEAAEAIMQFVLRHEYVDVMILHSRGLGPRKMLAALPGRLSFSIAEDLAEGIASLASKLTAECWMMARSDHRSLSAIS